ncbi:uncharacterized protein LOC113470863 [Diaphorina citri]|uniref:Uncharacterized protein LOC113470863 n=1 Tax=Diaphorina citri TaxID=121845 RepID=A0A3Q0JA50_DIACI|nr:uncharacterized protein LOC113470863 [Diaphorina citri]
MRAYDIQENSGDVSTTNLNWVGESVNKTQTRRPSLPSSSETQTKQTKRKVGGKKSQATPMPAVSRKSAAASTTPNQDKGKEEEIKLLKKLNIELLQRLKSIENELTSTRQKLHDLEQVSFTNTPTTECLASPVLPSVSESQSEVTTSSSHDNSSVSDSHGPRLLVCGDSMTRDFGNVWG